MSSLYDGLLPMTTVSRSSPGTSDQQLAAASYDGEGKRVSATESGVSTSSLYDGLLAVTERQGSITAGTNTWGLSYGGGIGGLLARTTLSGTLYPLYDGSGNILAWTDSSGGIVATTVYTGFGEVVAQTGSPPPIGFSTKSYSATTGMSYFGARYYSPNLSRWLTQDPLGMIDGPNLYAYVGNNPVNLGDPVGLLKRRFGPFIIEVEINTTLLTTSISNNVEGVRASDFSEDGLLPPSLGGGIDIRINPPQGPSPSQQIIAPFIGIGKNLSIGTNIIFTGGRIFPKVQGLNISVGYSIGPPVGVVFPGAVDRISERVHMGQGGIKSRR